MRRIISTLLAGALLSVGAPAFAKEDKSSAKKAQDKNMTEIPVCTRKLGTVAITEPETQWWSELGLSNPEAVIKFFVQKSGCFSLVDRSRRRPCCTRG